MKVSEAAAKIGLKEEIGGAEREIEGGYVGDLLSLVMSKAKAGDMWITIQTNINTVAVAVLTDVSCIVIADSQQPDAAMLQRAASEGVAVYTSDKSAFEIAAALSKLL